MLSAVILNSWPVRNDLICKGILETINSKQFRGNFQIKDYKSLLSKPFPLFPMLSKFAADSKDPADIFLAFPTDKTTSGCSTKMSMKCLWRSDYGGGRLECRILERLKGSADELRARVQIAREMLRILLTVRESARTPTHLYNQTWICDAIAW